MVVKYSPIRYKSVDVFVRDILKPEVDAQIRQLQLICDGSSNIPPKSCLKLILEKLEMIKSTGQGLLTSFELKTVSYHLIELSDSLRDYFLHKYLSRAWYKSAISGLMHSLLLGWHSPYAEDVRKALLEHKNDMSQLQTEAFVFMSQPTASGVLAEYLFNHKLSILSAPSFVLLQDDMFHYAYFEDVMISYFRKRGVTLDVLTILEEALNKHNNARSNRIVFPVVVLKAYYNDVVGEVKKVFVELASRLIGNPNDVGPWQDDTLNDKQKKDLLQARHILRTWMVARVIDQVFKKASATSYPDRAAFWRQYAEHLITQNDEKRPFLKILSKSSLSNVLNTADERKFYGRLYEGKENTAVLMRFGDYTLVELLEGGCMYVYKNTPSQYYRNYYNYVWSTSVKQIDDLKDTSVTVFLQDDIYNHLNTLPNNGCIAHRGNWQDYFRRFLLIKKIIV